MISLISDRIDEEEELPPLLSSKPPPSSVLPELPESPELPEFLESPELPELSVFPELPELLELSVLFELPELPESPGSSFHSEALLLSLDPELSLLLLEFELSLLLLEPDCLLLSVLSFHWEAAPDCEDPLLFELSTQEPELSFDDGSELSTHSLALLFPDDSLFDSVLLLLLVLPVFLPPLEED